MVVCGDQCDRVMHQGPLMRAVVETKGTICTLQSRTVSILCDL